MKNLKFLLQCVIITFVMILLAETLLFAVASIPLLFQFIG